MVQNLPPDQFFDAEQQRNLSELMASWRLARDSGNVLCDKEHIELHLLIEAELHASAKRSASMAEEAVKK